MHGLFAFLAPKFLERQRPLPSSSVSHGYLIENTDVLDTVQYRRLIHFLEDVDRYAVLISDLDLEALVHGCRDDLLRLIN